jgi:hypothetical protein
MSSRSALRDHELTDLGRIHRRTERCVAEYGLTFDLLCLLVAAIARHRRGLTTTRGEVLAFLEAEEGIASTPGFEVLRRKGFVKLVSKQANLGTWVPTLLAIAKFSSFGVEREVTAAE